MDVNVAKALKEAYEKEEKYFKIYDQYRCRYNRKPITDKFYSKYEAKDLSLADEELVRTIQKHIDMGPKHRQNWPETNNQEYGWFITPLVDYDRNDSRYYHPHATPEFIVHGLALKNDISMQSPKFTGLPFKLC